MALAARVTTLTVPADAPVIESGASQNQPDLVYVVPHPPPPPSLPPPRTAYMTLSTAVRHVEPQPESMNHRQRRIISRALSANIESLPIREQNRTVQHMMMSARTGAKKHPDKIKRAELTALLLCINAVSDSSLRLVVCPVDDVLNHEQLSILMHLRRRLTGREFVDMSTSEQLLEAHRVMAVMRAELDDKSSASEGSRVSGLVFRVLMMFAPTPAVVDKNKCKVCDNPNVRGNYGYCLLHRTMTALQSKRKHETPDLSDDRLAPPPQSTPAQPIEAHRTTKQAPMILLQPIASEAVHVPEATKPSVLLMNECNSGKLNLPIILVTP